MQAHSKLTKIRVLVLAFSDHRRDPRVHRQLEALKDCAALVGAGYGSGNNLGLPHVELTRRPRTTREKLAMVTALKTRRYDSVYWTAPGMRDARSALAGRRFDVIVANDIATLPLALELAGTSARVYLDSHEYQPRIADDQWKFRFLFQAYWEYLCASYLPSVHYMTTVCDGIAKEYERNFGVRCGVILNTPAYQDLRPSPVDGSHIRMVHHGAMHRSRNLEAMIELMDFVEDRFSLDLMLVNNEPKYLRRLQRTAKKHRRVRFVEPVAMPEISRRLNQYDIGLYMLSPRSFNCRMALPNKLFEFVQARLSICIWPSPEMRKIVEETRCGVAATEFSTQAMADTINALSTTQIKDMKANAGDGAARYNAETVKDEVRRILRQLSDGSASTPSGRQLSSAKI